MWRIIETNGVDIRRSLPKFMLLHKIMQCQIPLHNGTYPVQCTSSIESDKSVYHDKFNFVPGVRSSHFEITTSPIYSYCTYMYR